MAVPVFGVSLWTRPLLRLPELMARLQETEGVSLTGEQALALAAALGLSEEPYFFRFEELNSETFDTKLRAIEAEARTWALLLREFYLSSSTIAKKPYYVYNRSPLW